MCEQTLTLMEVLGPAIDAIPQFRDILDEIDGRNRRFVALSAADLSPVPDRADARQPSSVDHAVRVLRTSEFPGAVLAAGVGRQQPDGILVADIHCGTQFERYLRNGRTRDRETATHSAPHRQVPPGKDRSVNLAYTLPVCTAAVRVSRQSG